MSNKTIGKEDVRHMAALSRLQISEEEQELFARQLGDILGYMDVLARVDTNAVNPSTARPCIRAPCGKTWPNAAAGAKKCWPTPPKRTGSILSCRA